MLRLGIDLGGTKIAGVALEPGGATMAERRMAAPRHDYAATIEAIAATVAGLEEQAGGRGTIGIGTPSLHTGKRVSGEVPGQTYGRQWEVHRDCGSQLSTHSCH